MTLKSPLTVLVEKPATGLGNIMNDARSWLDNRKIQPIDFKTRTTDAGGVALEIKFNTEDEAYLFESDFNLAPSQPADRPASPSLNNLRR